jgi:hypothetical protein
MSKNTYKQATKFFGIPVPGYKDGIWPDLELLKWQIVENLLMAAMRGNVNAIFREGNMQIRRDGNGTYSVLLTAGGNEPSIQGCVAGAYFDPENSVIWSGLVAGDSYYLYIKGSESTFQDAKAVVPVASSIRLTMRYVTLVAKVNLTGDQYTIDRNPPGKVNARDLAQHALDYDNPHGEKMTQDELLVRKHLALGDNEDVDIEITTGGQERHFPASRLASVLSTETVDFSSGGPAGKLLVAGGKVLFATAVQVKEGVAGNVWIGFYGVDADVNAPNHVLVRNSGDSDLLMRAIIFRE